MSHAQNSVALAIRRSISHDEIVTMMVDDIDTAFAEIVNDALVDDYDHVDTTGYHGAAKREVWGTTESGDEWRVHLVGPVDSNCA